MSLQCFVKDTSGGQWWQIEQAIDASPTEPPVVISAEIDTDGLTLTLTFNRVVQFGAGGNAGLTISATAGAALLTYASGAGTSALVYNINREIYSSETVMVSYTQPGNGIEDLANVDLLSFAGRSVTNNSTTAALTITGIAVQTTGTSLVLSFNRAAFFGVGGNGGLTISPSGGAATLSYASGAGTTALTYTINREILSGETLTTSYVQPGNGIEDSTGRDLPSFSNAVTANNSTAVVIALTAMAINPAGNTITLTFNRAAVFGAGGNGGLSVTGSIGAATPTYSSGSGTTSLVYSLSRTIYGAETVTATYVQPGDGIEDTGGHDLPSFSNQAVTNSSTDNTVRLSWDTSSAIPAIGTAPPVSQLAAQYFFAATLAPNPNDGNRQYLYIPASTFNAAYWYNNTNTDVWGATLGKGFVQLTWMYSSTYANGALIYQLTAKSQNPVFDGNDGVALRTKLVSTAPAIGGFSAGTLDVVWPSNPPAINTKQTLIHRWNRMTSNPNNTRTMIVYLLQSDGNRASGYVTLTSAVPTQPVWHHFLPGNDTTTIQEQWDTDFTIGTDWTYDFPINVWQDFEFATLSQANLEANDHNPTAVWAVNGTTARFSTNTSAQYTSPSTINLWTDTGTRGIVMSLNATASGSFGITFTATAAARVWGHWVKFDALASGTSQTISFAGDATGLGSRCSFRVRNNAGQHEFFISNEDGSNVSSPINVSSGTWYWICVDAIRNSTCHLQVFDTTGTQVGTDVTCTGNNASIASIRIGSFNTTTSQASGVNVYIDNFVFEPLNLFPIKPWE